MGSKKDALDQIAGANQDVDSEEGRGQAMIAARDEAIAERDAANAALTTANEELTAANAAKDATIAELQKIIDDLNARPEVPDDVTVALEALRANVQNNFVA